MRTDDIVISGMGVVTAAGVSLPAQYQKLAEPASADHSLQNFRAAEHLDDRRLLKCVSSVDAVGLVAIEDLRRQIAPQVNEIDSWRIGLYVGGPPADVNDNQPYNEAISRSISADGTFSMQDFGRACMDVRPTTLLVGLPNNVLAYGAIMLNARGPHSNYVCAEISAHLAVINAAKRLRRGRLDLAFAGGFSCRTSAIDRSLCTALQLDQDIADGAIFLSLESRARANARGATSLATYLSGSTAADALGPLAFSSHGEAIKSAIRRAIDTAGVSQSQIGLVVTSGNGHKDLRLAEWRALVEIFPDHQSRPALATSQKMFGNLMEAGGLLELALAKHFYAQGRIANTFIDSDKAADNFPTHLDQSKRLYLVLRSSIWGEYSCLLLSAD